MLKFILSACLLLGSAAAAEEAAPNKNLEASAAMVAARAVVEPLKGEAGRDSIQGAKALWVDLMVQKRPGSKGLESLENDLRLSDMEGKLKDENFKILQPKKRSLATGLRPTLAIAVYYVAKGTQGNDQAYYLVTAQALQDVSPLGGTTQSMATWLHVGKPLVSTDDDAHDALAIRESAREGVKAFIEAAKSKPR